MSKDIGHASAAAWPTSLHHWSRPSGSGGLSPRSWLLRHLMPPGPEIPCDFHGTPWNSTPDRSCHLHADGRHLTDRPLSLCRASRWWLIVRGGMKQKEQAGYWWCNSPKAVKAADEQCTTLYTVLYNHMMLMQPDKKQNRYDVAHKHLNGTRGEKKRCLAILSFWLFFFIFLAVVLNLAV